MLAASIRNLFLAICSTLDVVEFEIYKILKPTLEQRGFHQWFILLLLCACSYVSALVYAIPCYI